MWENSTGLGDIQILSDTSSVNRVLLSWNFTGACDQQLDLSKDDWISEIDAVFKFKISTTTFFLFISPKSINRMKRIVNLFSIFNSQPQYVDKQTKMSCQLSLRQLSRIIFFPNQLQSMNPHVGNSFVCLTKCSCLEILPVLEIIYF